MKIPKIPKVLMTSTRNILHEFNFNDKYII